MNTTRVPALWTQEDIEAFKARWAEYRKAKNRDHAPLRVRAQLVPDSKWARWVPTFADNHVDVLSDHYCSSNKIVIEETGESVGDAHVLGQVYDYGVIADEKSLSRFVFLDDNKLYKGTPESEEHREFMTNIPRLTAPGFDLDMKDFPRAERVMSLINDVVGADGFRLRWCRSGKPEAPRFHGEFGPCEPGAETPELLRCMLGYCRDVMQKIGLQPRIPQPDLEKDKDDDDDKPGTKKRRVSTKPSYEFWVFSDDPHGQQFGAVDLSNLNKSAAGRGGMFRPDGGLHKEKVHRKTRLEGEPLMGSPIQKDLVTRGERLFETQQAAIGRPGLIAEARSRESARNRIARPKSEVEERLAAGIDKCKFTNVAEVYRSFMPSSPDQRHLLRMCTARLLHGQLRLSSRQVQHVVYKSFDLKAADSWSMISRDIEALKRGGSGVRLGGKSKILRDFFYGGSFLLELAQAYYQDRKKELPGLDLKDVIRQLLPTKTSDGASAMQRQSEQYCRGDNPQCPVDHRYRKTLEEMQPCGTFTRRTCSSHGPGKYRSWPCDRLPCIPCAVFYSDMLIACLRKKWEGHKRFLWIESPEFKTRKELWAWKKANQMSKKLAFRWLTATRGPDRFVMYLVTHDDDNTCTALLEHMSETVRQNARMLSLDEVMDRVRVAYLSPRVVAAGLFYTSWDEFCAFMDQVFRQPCTGSSRPKHGRQGLPWVTRSQMTAEYRLQKGTLEDDHQHGEECGEECEKAGLVEWETWDQVSHSRISTSKHPPTSKSIRNQMLANLVLWPTQREWRYQRLKENGQFQRADFQNEAAQMPPPDP